MGIGIHLTLDVQEPIEVKDYETEELVKKLYQRVTENIIEQHN